MDHFEWIGDYTLPPGTGLKFKTRSGSTLKFDPSTWDDWKAIEEVSLFKGEVKSLPNEYIQYKVDFFSDGNETPAIQGVSLY